MEGWKQEMATGNTPLSKELNMMEQVEKLRKVEDEPRTVDIDDPKYIDPNQQVEGEADGYTWKENPKRLEVKIPISRSIRSKDMEIIIKRNFLSMKIPKIDFVLEGELDGTVDADLSYWYIDDDIRLGETSVQIYLEKKKPQRIWAAVFKQDVNIEYVD